MRETRPLTCRPNDGKWWKADVAVWLAVTVKGNKVMLIYSIVATALCLTTALWPRRRTDAVEARIARGEDTFFEEQRSYQAYPWLRDPVRVRIVGIVGTVCGLIACALAIYRG